MSIILHVDMDAFFAAVEILDNPSLKDEAVIVGGDSKRSVVSTCSYEARKYGVRSGMSIYKAKTLCPKVICLPVRYARYQEMSHLVFEILRSVTNKIEIASIDEAYLDISGIEEDPKKVALRIKSLVKEKTGLTISVGLSYNKFLAKLASDWNKPDGLTVISEDMMPELLFPFSVSKIHGLGKKSTQRLNNIGIFTIEDLYKQPKDFFLEYLGKHGIDIYNRIRGIDNRELITFWERKSIGKESTLMIDCNNKDVLKQYLHNFSKTIEEYLTRKGKCAFTITLKIKTNTFVTSTRSKTFKDGIKDKEKLYSEGCKLLDALELKEPLRLIGLTASSLKTEELEQMKLL